MREFNAALTALLPLKKTIDGECYSKALEIIDCRRSLSAEFPNRPFLFYTPDV